MHDNARPERRLIVGFPDFVPTVEAEYPRFFEVGQRVLTAMHSVADREYVAPEPHQRAILNLSMLAGISLVEVVVLTAHGLSHGAMRIVRSLLETAVNVEYFRLHPEAFEDYKEWFHVERFRELAFVREHAPEIYAQVDAAAVRDAARQMARVRARFLMRDRNGIEASEVAGHPSTSTPVLSGLDSPTHMDSSIPWHRVSFTRRCTEC